MNRYTPEPRSVVAGYLELMRDSGITERWGRGSFRWAGGALPYVDDAPLMCAQPGDATVEYSEAGPVLSTLEEVRACLGDCTRCRLHEGRTNIVFGVGNPNAKLMFVGEGPGADEDMQGEPFVGKAGQLLTDIIEKGMKLSRADVYIANVVKCRPPGNRNPQPDEVATCLPFLRHQIDVIRPKIICALGNIAAQTLLETGKGITALRGNEYDYNGIVLIPTFHPSYLLRNPADKKLTWVDVQKIMALYDKL